MTLCKLKHLRKSHASIQSRIEAEVSRIVFVILLLGGSGIYSLIADLRGHGIETVIGPVAGSWVASSPLASFLLVLLTCMVLFAFSARWYARNVALSISCPLARLTEAAEHLAKGGDSAHLQPLLQRKDEIGTLARTLCNAFDAERGVRRELEALVDQRTQVLVEKGDHLQQALETLYLHERALAACSNGVAIVDMQGPGQRVVYVNPAFSKTTGYEASDVLGGNLNFLHRGQADSPELLELRKAIREHRSVQVTLQNFRKDGSPFWNQLSVAPVSDPLSGKVTHYVGIQNDVTERLESERALFDWFVRLDTIFTLSPDGFVSFDGNGRVDYVNPAFERLLGLKMGELAALDLSGFEARIRAQADPARPYPSLTPDALDEARPGTDTSGNRATLHLKHPEHRVLQRSLRACDSDTTTCVIYYRDITREVEIDRMKSEFLSTAAHELRTPMASVMGFSELLLTRDYDADRRRDLLQTINRQARRLTQLLNELLDLARIEARQGEDFKRIRQPLNRIIEDTLAALMMPDDPRTVGLRLTSNDICVVVDAAKIQQALTNVLSNAYKYSPDGGDITLEVLEDADRKRVGLRVSDHGIGMTPQQVSRAFERFFRADTSGNIPGTGLGLSLVKQIVELHEGEVELTSEPGEGTTITLWLPVAPQEAALAAEHCSGATA